MEVTSKVASIDNEGVSQGKGLAANKGNMRNWGGATQSALLYVMLSKHRTTPAKTV